MQVLCFAIRNSLIFMLYIQKFFNLEKFRNENFSFDFQNNYNLRIFTYESSKVNNFQLRIFQISEL